MGRIKHHEVVVCSCGRQAMAVLSETATLMVSIQDIALLKDRYWTESRRMRTSYAVSGRGRARGESRLAIHRLVVTFDLVDHFDRNGLNNMRENLVESTKVLNVGNIRSRSLSGLKGVRLHVNRSGNARWNARIGDDHLGYFESAEAAGKAYDRAAIAKFGKSARLNFPNG